jgi:hypothetical protein
MSSEDRPDPPPEPPTRPRPDPLEKEGKSLTDDPAPTRPRPDELDRVNEGDYKDRDDDE